MRSSVHRLSRILLTCSAHAHFRLLTCLITSVTFVCSLTHMFFFLSRYVMFTPFHPFLLFPLFVRLLACSLLGWWVPMFPRRMSLLEVCNSCRLVSSSMFQYYPWRCRGACRMLSIQPRFFFESPFVLFVCLRCCIAAPGRCSFQRSRSECCWHILVCRFLSSPLSSTCSSSDTDFHFHRLIPVAFVVACVEY